MARGITESDVWSASDALLLEGARPTIERVRQKMGRGSPNTVGPFLDTWFKNLGGRIKDAGAFAPPPGIPDPIVQAAKHFWETALAETRRDFDQRLQEGLAAAVANVEAEKERAAIAEAAAFDISGKHTRAQSELSSIRRDLERDRLTAAATEARLQEARERIEDLLARLQQAEAATSAARDAARHDISLAQERAAAVERRSTLEIDVERTARSKAERRVEAMERRLQLANEEAQAARTKHAEQAAYAQSEKTRLSAELAATAAAQGSIARELTAMTAALADARKEIHAARSQAELAERVIAAVRTRTPRSSTNQRHTKRTSDV
jgi:chromosome segregation ATPase